MIKDLVDDIVRNYGDGISWGCGGAILRGYRDSILRDSGDDSPFGFRKSGTL